MFGLVGAHRTGKTTLAKKFIEHVNIPYVASSASQVLRDLGIDPADDVPFETRMKAQEAILEVVERDYRVTKQAFITDRTPLDLLAYTLADVTRDNLTEIMQARVVRYQKKCFEVSNKYLSWFFMVPTGLPYKEEPGKPHDNLPYQEHIHFLCEGLMADERLNTRKFVYPRDPNDLNYRVGFLVDIYHEVQTRAVMAGEGRFIN